jgi:hypothetical protein
MKVLISLFLFGILTSKAVFGDTPAAVPPERPLQVIQDPKTKVIYYLESDRCHVAAINPDGRLLWCSEVASSKKGEHIKSFGFDRTRNGQDEIFISIGRSGWISAELGTVNKKTGAFELLFAG